VPVVVRKTGKIKFFDPRKGYGFIKPDDGSRDVHLSCTRLPKDTKSLAPDQRCSFVVSEDSRKGPYAKEFMLL
jgi:cold shock protein